MVALWYIVAVGFLVIVHEFGHFWVARRLGFKVLRFSVGFGKPIWRRMFGKDQTELVIGPIPMGGYVKMLDERDGPVPPELLARSFTRKPPWQRILVLLAGPGSTCCSPSWCCGACAGCRAPTIRNRSSARCSRLRWPPAAAWPTRR